AAPRGHDGPRGVPAVDGLLRPPREEPGRGRAREPGHRRPREGDEGGLSRVGPRLPSTSAPSAVFRGLLSEAATRPAIGRTVAIALEELPECARAFGEGRLGWDQVRPLTEFATPETDHRYATDTPGVSAARVEAEARRSRRVSRGQAEDEHRRRSLRWWWPSDGGLRLSGFLPSAEGAVVTAALERIVEQTAADGDGVADDPIDALSADALVALASTRVAEDADPDRACVVVHVDAEALGGDDDGRAWLGDSTPLNSEVLRRLACDA